MAGPKEIADLLAVSATDPLSLEPAATSRSASSRHRGRHRAADRPNSPSSLHCKRIGPMHSRRRRRELDALRDATQRAAQVRAHAEQVVVSGPLPVHADAEPDLRAALASITTPDPAALLSLQRPDRGGAAGRAARTNSSRRACWTVAANSRDG